MAEINISSDLFYFAFWINNYLFGFTIFFDEAIYYPENSVFITKEEIILDIERYINEKFGKKINNSYCLKDFIFFLKGNFEFNKLSYKKWIYIFG